jgi:hypothetical protein
VIGRANFFLSPFFPSFPRPDRFLSAFIRVPFFVSPAHRSLAVRSAEAACPRRAWVRVDGLRSQMPGWRGAIANMARRTVRI